MGTRPLAQSIQHVWRSGEEAVRKATRAAGHARPGDPLMALQRQWKSIEADYAAVMTAFDAADVSGSPEAPALKAVLEVIEERWSEMRGEIARTPATTLPGLVFKLRLTRDDVTGGPAPYAEEIIESALADVKRMAARGSRRQRRNKRRAS